MKIVYAAAIRLPTEKGHGLQIMQMCAAFAANGHDVTLVVPKRRNAIIATPWEYYGLAPTFRIFEVACPDFIPFDRWLGNAAFWLTTLGFALKARGVVASLRPDVVYSREVMLGGIVPRGTPFIFEAHDFPSRPWLYRRWWRACARIVTVTEGLKRAFLSAGVMEARLLTAHDAVDADRFRLGVSKTEARRELGLPVEGFFAVYTGHLYPYKGAEDLLEACASLGPGRRVIFVGGHARDVERLRAQAEASGIGNAIFTGQQPYARLPLYLRAADAAVLPTRASDRHAAEFLSPLKLFVALAAGKAVVSTDLPSIREVLDDRSAVLVPPGDPGALAAALNALADDPENVSRLGRAAEALAAEYAWTRRAERVLSGIADPHPAAFWFRRHRLPLCTALLALVLRAAYVLAVPAVPLASGDGAFYLAYADLFRGVSVWSARMVTFVQPGYPLFLALLRSIFGTNLVAIGLVQAAIGAATVGLVTHMAERLIGRRAALGAGLIGALYAPWIIETGMIYSETLYTFFLTLAAFSLISALSFHPVRRAALVGGIFAAAGLIRELALYQAALLAIVLGLWKRSWKISVGLLAPVLVVLAVFGAYNRLVARQQAVGHVPIFAKSYEATFADPASRAFLLRWRLYPEGLWRFLRLPNRLADISDQVSTKAVLLSGDRGLIIGEAPYIFAKAVLTCLHWMLLLLACYGLWRRGRLSKEAKAVCLLMIAFAAGTIVLSGAARLQGFAYLEPLARYRFPVEPLILLLAASGLVRLKPESL